MKTIRTTDVARVLSSLCYILFVVLAHDSFSAPKLVQFRLHLHEIAKRTSDHEIIQFYWISAVLYSEVPCSLDRPIVIF